MNQSNLRIAFAGDRDISVWVLEFLLKQGVRPEALLISSAKRASHADELISLCSFLPSERILSGKSFRNVDGRDLLVSLNLDYIVGIHFPYIVPQSVLEIPQIGVLNLHPAYLPYNRGWHTPSWAILEGKPIGATLHFMDSNVDTGDIVHQKRVLVSPDDTAHTLYKKLKMCELETFIEAWTQIAEKTFKRHPQTGESGTSHNREDLFAREIQEIDLNEFIRIGDILDRLRALTTNQPSEAAYFEKDGELYRVQIKITKE